MDAEVPCGRGDLELAQCRVFEIGLRWALAMSVSASLGPGEWLAALVPGVDERPDGIGEVADRVGGAAADSLAGDVP